MRVNVGRVLGHGVGHQTEFALVGHPPVGRVVAGASRNACCVGAVPFVLAVGGTPLSQYVGRRHVVATHGQAPYSRLVALGQLVPEGLDAVLRALAVVIEGGVGQVEAHVNHTHDDAPPGKGAVLSGWLIDGPDVTYLRHRVQCHAGPAVGLYTLNGGLCGQSAHLRQGYGDDAYVAQLRIERGAIGLQRVLGQRLAGAHEDGGQPFVFPLCRCTSVA